MSRYFKWPTKSGEAFASVPEGYVFPYIVGGTETQLVSIALSDPSVVEITALEWGKWNEKWRALFGSA